MGGESHGLGAHETTAVVKPAAVRALHRAHLRFVGGAYRAPAMAVAAAEAIMQKATLSAIETD